MRIDARAVTDELDELSHLIRKDGRVASRAKIAEEIDVVSNTLEALGKGRHAGLDDELVPRHLNKRNPGSEGADEDGRYDSYETIPKHRVPVGPRCLQELGAGIDDRSGEQRKHPVKSPSEYNLHFASEDPVYIMAGRRGRAADANRYNDPEELSDEPLNEKEGAPYEQGNPLDPFTTSGLPGSGSNEWQNPPVDRNQKGATLPVYGTTPYTHKKGVAARRRPTESRANQARRALERVAGVIAGPVIVKDAHNLHRDEFGDEVMRDQDLGGYGHDSRYPQHFPPADDTDDDFSDDESFDYRQEGQAPVNDEEIGEELDGSTTDSHFGHDDHMEQLSTVEPDAPDIKEDADHTGGEFPEDEAFEEQKKRKSNIEYASRRGSRTRVAVYTPQAVPDYLEPLWNAATARVAAQGSLLNKRGKVDYLAIASAYQNALRYHAR